jgi:hypothetical protein
VRAERGGRRDPGVGNSLDMWTTIHSDYSRVGSRAIEEWIWSEQRAVEADQLTIMSELHLMQLRGAELWKQVLCPSKIESGEGEACGRA